MGGGGEGRNKASTARDESFTSKVIQGWRSSLLPSVVHLFQLNNTFAIMRGMSLFRDYFEAMHGLTPFQGCSCNCRKNMLI